MATALQARPVPPPPLSRDNPQRASGYITQNKAHYWLLLQRKHVPTVALISFGFLLLGSTLIYLLERGSDQRSISSFGEALWYSVVTMTTVGYGDLTPHTLGGRSITVGLMLGGMTLLSLFTASIASILVTEKIKKAQGMNMLERIRDHVLVCGWNQHAEHVLEGLRGPERQAVVLINELPEEGMREASLRYADLDVAHVQGDAASETVLDRASARYARSAIVLADTSNHSGVPSDERTTLVTLAIKSIRANVEVTAEALDARSETHLRRAGADNVVITGEFNGFLLSRAATMPGISDVVRSMLARSAAGLSRRSIPAELVGSTFGEVAQALRLRDGFLSLAIVTDSRGLTLDELLKDDHSLVDQFIRQQFAQAGVDFLRFEDAGQRVIVNPTDSYVLTRQDSVVGIPRSE